jgi:hypothetical protein
MMAESYSAEKFTSTNINTKKERKKRRNVDHGTPKVVASDLERIHKKIQNNYGQNPCITTL